MKLYKPTFWEKKSLIPYLLFPFSLITSLINQAKKKSNKTKFNIKTICIGNIYLGGTGKTSLAIEIYKILSKKFDTVFIKKKYNDQIDEIKQLSQKGNIIINKDRKNSLFLAEKKKFNIAILDDGLQQKNIHYDLSIACFNSQNGFGNKFIIPSGPLRENIKELKEYDVLISLSEHEGFSRVLLEAIYVGLYCVAFKNSGTEFIKDFQNTKTIDSKDLELIKNEIIKILNKDKNISLNNRKMIIEKYSTKKIANSFNKIYKLEI